MEKYVCTVCGYTYDAATGDTKSGVAAGTHWDNVEESWCCPVCNVDKSQFEAIE